MSSNHIHVPRVILNNGYEMPVVGYGTRSIESEEAEADIQEGIKCAIDVGYRHIDTSFYYQNEVAVGRAIRDKIGERVTTRDEMFIVTKLWSIHHDPDKVEPACRKSIKNLGLTYIDLYLMQLPIGFVYIDEETLLPKDEEGKLLLSDVDYLDTYKEMEKLVKNGLVRSIGVSNFNSEQIQRILDNCEIHPVTNQVECHPGLNQIKLIEFCKDREITLTAYFPLGRPRYNAQTPEFFFSDITKDIAKKYNKTPAQVILRFLIDIGAYPIPRSSNANRVRENIDIFDFKLDTKDIEIMQRFNNGHRLVPLVRMKEQKHKYFPFDIEF